MMISMWSTVLLALVAGCDRDTRFLAEAVPSTVASAVMVQRVQKAVTPDSGKRSGGAKPGAFDRPTVPTTSRPKNKVERKNEAVVEPRIVGGYDATRGRYPWMASIRYGGPYNHVCGGTLIAPDIILSAAHCAPFFDTVDVGRYDISDNLEPYTAGAEVFVIDSFVVHPEYKIEQHESTIDFDMDFLLIKVHGWSDKEPVKLNSDDSVPSREGQSVTVMGWGLETANSKRVADILNVANLEYLSNSRCDDAKGYVDGTFYYGSYDRLITESMMCATDPNRDSCQGDSGGPLIVKGSNSATDKQVGIVSFGFGCADADFPGVYSRVSSQWTWIREHVCKLSIDPPSSFGCAPRSEPSPSNGGRQIISLAIQFDEFPWEQGCVLTSRTGGTPYAYFPIGFFKNYDSYSVFKKNIEIDADADYKFVMFDAFGDGMSAQSNQGRYWLYSEANNNGDIMLRGGGNYGFSKEHFFSIGDPVASSPTPPPTDAPQTPPVDVQGNGGGEEEEVFLTIVIQFDGFPEETAWVVSDVKTQSILASKRYGDYDENLASKQVTETVKLPGRAVGTREYLITFLDKSGDGLCCAWGDGSYEIYWRDDLEDVLFSGRESFAMEQWLLTVLGEDDPRRTAVPIPSSTPAPAPAPMAGGGGFWSNLSSSPSPSLSVSRVLVWATMSLSVWILLR